MKEHPIIFSAEMVRAILDGRKTQTRRIVKPQPGQDYRLWHGDIDGHWAFTNHEQGEKGNIINVRCPYGQPGDLLWVRETFWTAGEVPVLPIVYKNNYVKTPNGYAAVVYRADSSDDDTGWKPSIHMPRWASRITLQIVNVRVERLQDMSLHDWVKDFAPTMEEQSQARASFTGAKFQIDHSRQLWDSINGKRAPWDSNPYVWVIEFVTT